MVVEAYLGGKGSAVDLAAKYRISTANILLRWVFAYNANRELKEDVYKRQGIFGAELFQLCIQEAGRSIPLKIPQGT